MNSRHGAPDYGVDRGTSPLHAAAPARPQPWNRLRGWLVATRATDEEDRRRELALNLILLSLIAVALEEVVSAFPR